MFVRTLYSAIEKSLFSGKAIIIYGARQVGKTTILKQLQQSQSVKTLYLNCDEPDIRDALTNKTSTALKSYMGNTKLVLIDEAQRVHNIGLTLKLLVDNYPDLQIVATGSSAFELSNSIVEPLTGRKIEYYLLPFSLAEISTVYTPIEIKRLLEQRIIFGMYPDIINHPDQAAQSLKEITRSYLFKDVLNYQAIKHPEILEKLLQSLALQIGSEVSYTELASHLSIDKKTIESYIQLLEQAFILFRLRPYSTNQRNELKKMRKIYFYDTGIRNMVINNLNPPHLRQDMGHLWENFLVSERFKYNNNQLLNKNIYFWRNHQNQEIDYLEDYNGLLHAYEFKFGKKSAHHAKAFLANYPDSALETINQDNFFEFLGI